MFDGTTHTCDLVNNLSDGKSLCIIDMVVVNQSDWLQCETNSQLVFERSVSDAFVQSVRSSEYSQGTSYRWLPKKNLLSVGR
jgi:hypothetical protein